MTRDVAIEVIERQGRRFASTGSPWEPVVGYSRAVRVGDLIAVTGTVGLATDGTYPPSAAQQTRRALEIILAAIEALGGDARDIVRTRLYVTNIRDWEAIGRAHAEVLGSVRPATTMVQVAALIDPEAVVEIEADAIVSPK